MVAHDANVLYLVECGFEVEPLRRCAVALTLPPPAFLSIDVGLFVEAESSRTDNTLRAMPPVLHFHPFHSSAWGSSRSFPETPVYTSH